MQTLEPVINKWGQWINLNWDWSRRKCDERVFSNKHYIGQLKMLKGNDWVWLPDGRLGQVQSCNYIGYDPLFEEHRHSIVVAFRSKLHYFHNLNQLKLEKNMEVINRNKGRYA